MYSIYCMYMNNHTSEVDVPYLHMYMMHMYICTHCRIHNTKLSTLDLGPHLTAYSCLQQVPTTLIKDLLPVGPLWVRSVEIDVVSSGYALNGCSYIQV